MTISFSSSSFDIGTSEQTFVRFHEQSSIITQCLVSSELVHTKLEVKPLVISCSAGSDILGPSRPLLLGGTTQAYLKHNIFTMY